jgi:[ribosomal protein S5]-alanine N-acetyltransferase
VIHKAAEKRIIGFRKRMQPIMARLARAALGMLCQYLGSRAAEAPAAPASPGRRRRRQDAGMPPLIAPVVPAGSLARVPQPVLPAGDLRLRPWTAADADALVTAFADPAIQRWHARTVESRAEAQEMIARYVRAWPAETGAHWAITGPAVIGAAVTGPAVTGPAVLGRCALRTIDLAEGLAEIAYWVTPAARGRSAAARAAAAVSRWALGDLGLHRIELNHAVANPASCRVAQAAGFAYEGTRRSAALHADGWHDMHLHATVSGAA